MPKLDKRFIDSLEPPSTGNRIVYDDEVKGFGVRITAKGARAFVLNYRAKGIERRLTIGSYPDWSASAARKEAAELKKRVDLGEDPMADRHEERAAPTFADLAKEYLENHAPKKRTGGEDEKTLGRHILPRFGRMKVRDITHKDIDRFHRDRNYAPIQANREAALLSKMFSLAVKWGYRPDNPVNGLERYPENKRERYLTVDEISQLLAAMDIHKPSNSKASADAIRLLLLTGARCGEVMSATWEMFDFEAGVWVKPSAHTKQKKIHRAPLSAPALSMLVEMRRQAEADAKTESRPVSQYLFPGRGDAPHLTEVKKYWDTIRRMATVSLWASKPETQEGELVLGLVAEDGSLPSYEDVVAAAARAGLPLPAGLTDVHLHDLRHTYASILASAGMSLPIIGRLLGHTQAATTARYAHLFDDPLREATNRVGSLLQGLGNGKVADVIPLPKKQA